jgi:hypothetical protein
MGISPYEVRRHSRPWSSTQSQPDAPRLLNSRREAARQLSISVRSLDYMVAGRQLTTKRIGNRILIPHAELVRLATTAQVKSVVSSPS